MEAQELSDHSFLSSKRLLGNTLHEEAIQTIKSNYCVLNKTSKTNDLYWVIFGCG